LSHASHRASLELEAEESAGNRTRTEFRSELSAAAGGGVIIRDQTDDARGSLLSIPPLVYGSAPALGAPTVPSYAPAPAGIAAWPAPLRWALVVAVGAVVFAVVVALVGGERDVVVLPPPSSAVAPTPGVPAAPRLEPSPGAAEPANPGSERDRATEPPPAESGAAASSPAARPPAPSATPPPIPSTRPASPRTDVARGTSPTRRSPSRSAAEMTSERAASAPDSSAAEVPPPSPPSPTATAQPARGEGSNASAECSADNLDRLIEATKLDAARATDPLKTRVLALCAQAYMLRDCDRLRRAKGLLSTGMLAPGP
jgi:hypothetical protein